MEYKTALIAAFLIVGAAASPLYNTVSRKQLQSVAYTLHKLADQFTAAGQDETTVQNRLAEYANKRLDMLRTQATHLSDVKENIWKAAETFRSPWAVPTTTEEILQKAIDTKSKLLGSDFKHLMPSKSKTKDVDPISLVPVDDIDLSAGGPIINVLTKYNTDAVHIAHPKDPQVFAASTCKHFQGKDVHISVLLLNNQDWDPDNGIVYFYATAPVPPGEYVTADKILCTNNQAKGPAKPTCDIKNWPLADDLHIHTMSGDVDDIAFTVVVEFVDPKPKPPPGPPSMLNATQEWTLSPTFEPFKPPKPILYLSQTVQVRAEQKMPYKTNKIIKMSWCPNTHTGSRYAITSTVMGMGLQSTFAQYACRRMPCNIDSPEVFASNGRQLPLNILPLTTVSGDIVDLYVLIRCWGGDYKMDQRTYEGKFRYGATLQRL